MGSPFKCPSFIPSLFDQSVDLINLQAFNRFSDRFTDFFLNFSGVAGIRDS